MITDFMASAKQIAWRKKFARMSKAGVFRTTKKGKARAKETAEHLGGIRRSRELDELEKLNDTISQFEMVNMSPQSQKILDSMKKRRDILSKKY